MFVFCSLCVKRRIVNYAEHMRILAAFLLALSTLMGASKLLVTVVDPKSGVVVPGLKAEDFSVLDD